MPALPVQPMPDSNDPGWTLEHTDGLTYMLWAPRAALDDGFVPARTGWAAHVCRTLDGEPLDHRTGESLTRVMDGFGPVEVRQAFREAVQAADLAAEAEFVKEAGHA